MSYYNKKLYFHTPIGSKSIVDNREINAILHFLSHYWQLKQ